MRAARARGFTLIEVLVAMLLLAILMAGAWGGIHAATHAIHSGDRAIERTNRLRLTQQFLRRQISHTLPLAWSREHGTGTPIVFEGDEDFMRYVAPMPGYLSKGGAYVQSLSFAGNGSETQLVFRHYMLNGFDLDAITDEDGRPEPLLDKIADAHFSYRGLDEEGKLDEWVDEWEEQERLPVMVRVELEMEEGSGITWPTMEIPLMLDIGSMRHRRSLPMPPGGDPTGRRPPPAPVRPDEGVTH